MSFFKSLGARLGVGAASVDLVLDQSTAYMGSEVSGTLMVTGGNLEQQIDDIEIELRVYSEYRQGDTKQTVDYAVAGMKASSAFKIQAGEKRQFPIRFQIPTGIPFSTGIVTRYYFKTNLDIPYALDAVDTDRMFIKPSGILENFMEGMQLLGCELQGEGFTGNLHILRFRQTSWMRGKLDELVFSYETRKTDQVLTGFFEVDKKTSGFMGGIMDELDLDEKKGRFTFSAEQLSSPKRASQTVRDFVERIYDTLMG